jgi:serine/threonine protein phosphatase PrpC
MRFAARTHPGRRGGQNEDAMGWDESQSMWFVADGMGGHASGEVASRVVKEALLACGPMPLGQALETAHAAVLTTAATDPAYDNMGSTAVAIRVGDGATEVAWVGDSRAYLWRGNTLEGLTRDHSFLELLREQEGLTDTQLRNHPNRNLVTQTLGIGLPEPSVSTVPLHHNDWLLLCSDGLNDELEDDEIGSILGAHPSPEAAADALIAAALAKGGHDNVSVVLVEYDGPDGVSSPTGWQKNVMMWLPLAAGVLAACLVAWAWWRQHGTD